MDSEDIPLNISREMLQEDRLVPLSERSFEYLMNALRLNEGFDVDDYQRRTGLDRASLMPALTQAQAEGFYAVHAARPFFASLTSFMASGPAIVLVLEAEDAIAKWRTLMGATDPSKADAGTLRKEFAQSIERNATHGSDAPETAAYEIGYFFAGIELN